MYESLNYKKRFGITRQDLAEIVTKLQQRQFAEDIDFIETRGGDKLILEALNVNVAQGIRMSEVAERTTVFGSNKKKEKELPGFWELFWEALEDTTLRILLAASIFSIVVEVATADESHRKTAWIEGFAIFVAVMICSTVTAGNNYKQERQFRLLYNEASSRKKLSVIRDGADVELLGEDLVVGDVVKIFEGIDIPADGFVIEGHEISTDESAMTGEPDAIKKEVYHKCLEKRNQIVAEGSKNTSGHHAVPSPILYSGTKIINGDGKFVVIVVGELSCVGKIEEKLHQEAEATPLQQKLETIADDIGKFGLKASVLTILVLLIRFIIDNAGKPWDSSNWGEILQYIIIGITVMVVAIPEGLPLAVTLSLAYSVKKMLNDNNLVRRLAACETMGGANIICSDKTGTLTENKMTVTTLWNQEFIDVDTYADKIELSKYVPPPGSDLLTEGIACNSTATTGAVKIGSKTEIAMLEFLDKAGISYLNLRTTHLGEEFVRFPFSSKRKRMSTILEKVSNGSSTGRRLHVKGASEYVLEACTHLFSWKTGQKIPLTPDIKATMQQVIDTMASRALRTLCLAYRDINIGDDVTTKDNADLYEIEKKDLVCICLIGIKDIIRKEVEESIKKCKRAGITVKMVTGDNKLTAQAIAKECGIIQAGDTESIILEGLEFNERIGGVVCRRCRTQECGCPRDQDSADLQKKEVRVDTIKNGEEFDRIWFHLNVLARSRPEDKYALVCGLKERGLVVAVTGDGTNDAPALKKADVGFAMGISGTEVAREASAIILLDDNFKSIVAAVIWGRNIYDSIRKFIQFQLTVNVVAVVCTLIGAALLRQSILTAIQMLWVNLIMDTFASLALATEPPTEALLDREPHNRDDYIISRKMMKHIIGQSMYQLIVILILVFGADQFVPEVEPYDPAIVRTPEGNVRSGRLYHIDGEPDYEPLLVPLGPSRHFTVVYNTFVFMQIFNFINARKLNDEYFVCHGMLSAPLFNYIVIFVIGAQILIVEFGYLAFECHNNGLSIVQWGICVAFAFVGLPLSIVLKAINEKRCCPQIGNKKTNPLTRKTSVLDLKRPHSDKSLSRRFSQANEVGKKPSLQKLHLA